MTRSDELGDLIDRVTEGDEDALRRLYEAASPKLWGICKHVLGEDAAAEDALVQIFVDIRSQGSRSRQSGLSGMAWLATLARQICLEFSGPLPADAGALNVGDGATAAALSGLEPQHEQALREAYLGGADYGVLSERYGMNLGDVRGWMRDGLAQLQAGPHDG